jgi:hypothetical protein
MTGRLSNLKKSAFQAEGKMNKVGPCTAAALGVAKKAQF